MEFKLAKKRQNGATKKHLGRYYLTFSFGNDAEGEKTAKAFKVICDAVGGAPTALKLILDYHNQMKKK